MTYPNTRTQLILCAFLGLTATVAQSQQIDVQFSGTFTCPNPCGTRGTAPSVNPAQTGAAVVGNAGDVWNDFSATSLSGVSLVNTSGVATGASLSMSEAGTYSGAYTSDPTYDAFTGTSVANLMQGYLFTATRGTITISLTGLGADQSYNLYVYTQGDNNSNGRSIVISAGGVSQIANQTNLNSLVLDNNYVSEQVTTNAAGDLSIVGTTLAGEGNINGFQLVSAANVPEPGSVALLGLGFAGLAYRRWRRTS